MRRNEREISGFIALILNGKNYLVRGVHLQADIKSEKLPLTFYVEDLENPTEDIEKRKFTQIRMVITANLVHDLIEFSELKTQDFFVITCEGNEALWRTIPEEEWKKLLKKK